MSQYILDTDHFSLWQRNHPVVTRRVREIISGNITVTVITAEELLRGRFHVIRQASQSNQAENLVSAYMRLWQTLYDLKSIDILTFDQKAGDRFTELRRQKIRIGTQDLRIAAIALSRNAILVTRNQRDFAKVPGLRLADWTI